MYGVKTTGTGTEINMPVRPDGWGGNHPGVTLEFPLGSTGRHLDLEDHRSLGRPILIHLLRRAS